MAGNSPSPGGLSGKEVSLILLQPLPFFSAVIFQSLEVQGIDQGEDVGGVKPEIN